jgi:hypothetical protein
MGGHASTAGSTWRCVSRRDVKQVPRWRSATRRPPRVPKKGAWLDPSGYDAGNKIKGLQAAYPARYARSLVAPGEPTVPVHPAHFYQWRICRRQDGVRCVAHRAWKFKDIRLDQLQSPLGARLRTSCHDGRCLHSPRHDPHPKATCCKCLVMNLIFLDGFLKDDHNGPLRRLLSPRMYVF